jgi:transposase
MKRYVEGQDRSQATLFPESLEEYIAEDNPVRVVDVFVDELDMKELGFEGAEPEATGRPSYHPSTLLKIYIYGYLNRIQSSRRLERETQRNVELIWLTGRLSPDFKTIADFRKDNGPAIRRVCREFVLLCRSLNLFSDALVAIDGSKFKAVNGRDRNFTKHKLKARMRQLEESIARYLADLDRADRDHSDEAGALCRADPLTRLPRWHRRRLRLIFTFTNRWRSLRYSNQLLVHRATALANAGPTSNTRMNRAICMAITNGTSTWGEEAAMIATESAPPGLVARYAVRGSVPTIRCSSTANPPHSAISVKVEAKIFGNTRAA